MFAPAVVNRTPARKVTTTITATGILLFWLIMFIDAI